MTAFNRELGAQDISKGPASNSARAVIALPQSDFYFPDNKGVEAELYIKPPRDPGSITAPSIPRLMEAEPPTRQQATNSAVKEDFNSFSEETGIRTAWLQQTPALTSPQIQYSAERLLSLANGLPVDNSPPDPGNSIVEPNLELSSSLQMADPASQRQIDSQSREIFWDEFSTMPHGDRYGRIEGYDSLPAILHNGFWFGGVDAVLFEPIFQNNNVIAMSGNGSSTSVPADYNFDSAWKGYFGFETNAGPAIKASFFRYNEFSGPVSFVSDGSTSGESIVQTGDPLNVFRLAATNAGDRIETRQQIKLNSIDLLYYKDQKNTVSRVRGNLGLRLLSLQQFLFTDLFETAGPVTSLRSVNDYQAMGPKLGIEYFRLIGNTDLELQSGLFGSLMLGRRDHVVTDVGNLQYSQIGKIEPLSIFESYLGVQWNFRIARCQTGFFRTAIETQYWTGGESPVETGTDFGFYGFSAGFGVQR